MRNAAFLTRDQIDALAFASCGEGVLIHETCVLVGCSKISIGDHTRIDPFCLVSASTPMSVGSHVHIAAHCLLSGVAGITIGDFAGVSHGTRILSASDNFMAGVLTGPTIPAEFRQVDAAPVALGRHSVVGANCVVLPGVQLGEGATVGALSLLKGIFEPWKVYAGVPARPIGARDREGILRAERDFLARAKAP